MSEIQSPCIRNCCLDNEDVCMGCFRHIEEIKQWGLASHDLKKKFLKNSAKRKELHQLKYKNN